MTPQKERQNFSKIIPSSQFSHYFPTKKNTSREHRLINNITPNRVYDGGSPVNNACLSTNPKMSVFKNWQFRCLFLWENIYLFWKTNCPHSQTRTLFFWKNSFYIFVFFWIFFFGNFFFGKNKFSFKGEKSFFVVKTNSPLPEKSARKKWGKRFFKKIFLFIFEQFLIN